MKINQSTVNTQPKMPVRENTERTGISSDAQIDEKSDESGVQLNVSQRNVVDVSDENVSEKPAGGIKALLEKLIANPESTAAAHSAISAEKVLQLLG